MMEQCKEKLSIAMFGQKRIPSREGGVEIVVEELCTRMVAQGHNVTCYNRGGHHVSGSEYDSKRLKEYKGIKLKTVPTIEKKGLAAVSSSFLQHYVVLLVSMMLFIFMQRDRHFLLGYQKCLVKSNCYNTWIGLAA